MSESRKNTDRVEKAIGHARKSSAPRPIPLVDLANLSTACARFLAASDTFKSWRRRNEKIGYAMCEAKHGTAGWKLVKKLELKSNELDKGRSTAEREVIEILERLGIDETTHDRRRLVIVGREDGYPRLAVRRLPA